MSLPDLYDLTACQLVLFLLDVIFVLLQMIGTSLFQHILGRSICSSYIYGTLGSAWACLPTTIWQLCSHKMIVTRTSYHISLMQSGSPGLHTQ